MTRTRAPPVGKYAVGYKQPPVASRFKPGTSGNPRGRPKQVREIGAILEKALDSRVVISEHGRRRSITMLEAIVRGLVHDAARRDAKALRLLLILLDRHSAGGGGTSDATTSPAQDSAIIADFLARQDPLALHRGGSPPDRQSSRATEGCDAEPVQPTPKDRA